MQFPGSLQNGSKYIFLAHPIYLPSKKHLSKPNKKATTIKTLITEQSIFDNKMRLKKHWYMESIILILRWNLEVSLLWLLESIVSLVVFCVCVEHKKLCNCISSSLFSLFPSLHFFWADCQNFYSQRFILSYQEIVWPRFDSFLGQTK